MICDVGTCCIALYDVRPVLVRLRGHMQCGPGHGSKIGDQVGSGDANRRPGGAQRMYGRERDTGQEYKIGY